MARWLLLSLSLALAGSARAEVRLERATGTGDGGVGARYRQTWRGLDVVGGSLYVRTDGRGLVRWSSGEARPLPDDLDDQPLIDPAQAIAMLGRGEFPVEDTSRLVVWAPPGRRARLAWDIRLPRDLDRLEVLRGFVDAHTGELLATENLVKHARQARVFASNPTTSTLSTVTLDLPAGAKTLSGSDFVALNCVDKMSCPLHLSGGDNARWCEIQTLAVADGSGDFLYERPASDTEKEDPFAEVQMYYHATHTLEYFRTLGFTRLAPGPMQAIVNLRMPDKLTVCHNTSSSTVALVPHENAAFVPAGAYIPKVFPESDAVVFGQGEEVDYSYDGDVIAHELTHAVVFALTPMGTASLDAHGLDPTMFAMHEGFADFFASGLSGDPDLGEYVGPAINGKPGPLRSMINARTCPEYVIGEEHYDSEIWSAALWQIRSGMAEADRPRFDKAVLHVIDSLGDVESFDTVQRKIVAEVRTSMTAEAADGAQRIFTARGLDGCAGRIVPVNLGAPKQVLLLKGTSDIPELSRVPAPVQLTFKLTKKAKEIRVTIDASGSGLDTGDGTPRIGLLIKEGSPIAWDPDKDTDDAASHGDVTIDTKDPQTGTGHVSGNFPPGTYYALFTNAGDTWVVARIRFSSDVEGPAAGGGDDGGCGCAVGAGSGGRGAAGWLVILCAPLALLAGRRARRWRDRRSARPSLPA